MENVLRLKRANLRRIRDRFGITMQRTVQELNGEPWLELDEAAPIAKQVMSSRSFGQRVESLQELREAISYHAANAAQRLRKQGLFASAVSVFIQNSPFDQAEFYGRTETVALPAPTECSLQITNAALWLLKKMYRPEVYYQKAGVMLSELVPEEGQQTDLFAYSSSSNKSGRLMDSRGSDQQQIPAQHHSFGIRGSRPNLVHAAQLQESELHGRLERAAGGELTSETPNVKRGITNDKTQGPQLAGEDSGGV